MRSLERRVRNLRVILGGRDRPPDSLPPPDPRDHEPPAMLDGALVVTNAEALATVMAALGHRVEERDGRKVWHVEGASAQRVDIMLTGVYLSPATMETRDAKGLTARFEIGAAAAVFIGPSDA